MPKFFIIRLGKDSVDDIRSIDALKGAPDKPFEVTVTCTQVPTELSSGDYAFIWIGSDNNKGRQTSWKQGMRAVAVVTAIKGGPGYNDNHDIGLRISVILPSSVDKKDLLAKASAAYYWMSDVPVAGLSSSSNQTAQQIKTEEQQQDVRALFYALEAVHPGFRAQLSQIHPELAGFFNYTPPSPGSGSQASPGETTAPAEEEEASLGAPKFLPADWILALASKGFILISGPSGTGKSRTARDIARALDYALEPEYSATANACRPANCLAFVPVGADWTDGTPLLGFRNFFGPSHLEKTPDGGESESYENWEPPAALRLLLRALRRPDQPHFLVLDEMNLSHVERYFSQFLSLLESNRGLSSSSKLNLLDAGSVKLIASTLAGPQEHPLEKSVTEELAAANLGLTLPENLFIVGTVNVDETTYMFSPKVLDRAHVIEMHTPDPAAYMRGELARPGALIPADKAQILLIRSAQRRRNGFWERENPVAILRDAANGTPFVPELTAIVGSLEKLLAGLQKLLEPVGFGFAYRTINEVCAYLATYVEYADPTLFSQPGETVGWHEALDRAVCQKVLPKIHGNRRQLGESLRALHGFLMDEPASYALGSMKVEIPKELATGLVFPISAAKVKAMLLRLEGTGHTTFVI
jgi:hypothetical protein